MAREYVTADASNAGSLRTLLARAFFSAVAATLVSAALLVLWFACAGDRCRSPAEYLRMILIMSLFTALPAGTFGFMAGIAGTLWLSRRAKHTRAFGGLVVDALVAGTVLSLPFPVFYWILGRGSGTSPFDAEGALFAIAVGIPVAALFVLVFGRSILRSSKGSDAELP